VALDWGIGRYEDTGRELEPVASLVVQRAAVRPGERALDLGTGTGNAALELARAGAIVTAIDPAARLLEVARSRAAATDLVIDAQLGEAAVIPLEDDSVDLIVSVFAVIFAPDPRAAMAEMARVLAPGGRILLTAWIPGGGIGRKHATFNAYLGEQLGIPPAPPPFTWHDRDALASLAEPLGLQVSVDEGEVAFTADSPESQVERDATTHPMWIDGLARAREAGGDLAELRARLIATTNEINEDPAAFKSTGRYVIATLTSS
jgi:SAM-dependent methyltransferase